MPNKNLELVNIESKIFTIRGVRVMIDRDLAALYGIQTFRLNEAVKRNKKRFPENFMFQLSKEEKQELIANCDRFKTLKHSPTDPYAFTEHGVAMLSSVLNSERAIQINIAIINAFIALRRYVLGQKPDNIKYRIGILEKTLLKYMDENDKRVSQIVETINNMLDIDEEENIKQIGFIK